MELYLLRFLVAMGVSAVIWFLLNLLVLTRLRRDLEDWKEAAHVSNRVLASISGGAAYKIRRGFMAGEWDEGRFQAIEAWEKEDDNGV